MDAAAKERAAARALWPGARTTLAHQDESTAPPGATPSELVAMVWGLTLDAWAMSGKALPTYERSDAPGRVTRCRGTPRAE